METNKPIEIKRKDLKKEIRKSKSKGQTDRLVNKKVSKRYCVKQHQNSKYNRIYAPDTHKRNSLRKITRYSKRLFVWIECKR